MNHCRILVGLLLGMCVLATGCAESTENGAGADSRKALRRGNGSEPAALDPALASQPGRSRLHTATARQCALVGRVKTQRSQTALIGCWTGRQANSSRWEEIHTYWSSDTVAIDRQALVALTGRGVRPAYGVGMGRTGAARNGADRKLPGLLTVRLEHMQNRQI